jgi:hypothetical protein
VIAGPLVVFGLGLPLAACALAGEQPTPSPSPTQPPFKSFSLYVLSRGKGVPPEAREALRKARELIEADRRRGLGMKLETKRLGIEGETRLCAEYEDAKDAGRAFERVSALVKGVDLANLVVEPCTKPGSEGQKEEPKP